VCVFGAILVFIKTAFGPVGTAIAGTGGPVSSGTLKRGVFRAIQSALPAIDTPAVVRALQGHLTFVSKSPVESDFFADSGVVFANSLCGGSL